MANKYGNTIKDLNGSELDELRAKIKLIDLDDNNEFRDFVFEARDTYMLSFQAIAALIKDECNVTKSRQAIYKLYKKEYNSRAPKIEIRFKGDGLEEKVIHLKAIGYDKSEIVAILRDEMGDRYTDDVGTEARGVVDRYKAETYDILGMYVESTVSVLLCLDRCNADAASILADVKDNISYMGYEAKVSELNTIVSMAYTRLIENRVGNIVSQACDIFGDTIAQSISDIIMRTISDTRLMQIAESYIEYNRGMNNGGRVGSILDTVEASDNFIPDKGLVGDLINRYFMGIEG